jgi:pseudouridine synthase
MPFVPGEGREAPSVSDKGNLRRGGPLGRPGRRVQLHRAVSKLGWGSRTQAREWILAGEVCVDGRVVLDPLSWIDLDRQQVTRQGRAGPRAAHTSLALHKPRGVVTTRSDERGRKTVYDLLPPGLGWVFPAGRLDADSEGLLILTSDAQLAMRLTEPEHRVAKTYRVSVSGRPTEEALQRLRDGVELDDGLTRPAQVRLLRAGKRSVLEMVLTEGRNRQVRRMLAAVECRVRRLVRVAIGGLELGELKAGEVRVLGEEEIARMLSGAGAGEAG